MGLISIEHLDARGVEYESVTAAQAAIDDASAAARLCAAGKLDGVSAPDAPGAVVAIVVNMVRRVLANPRALTQEQLGDYMYSTGSQGVASLLPTAREKKMIRRAVGASSAGSVELSSDLPRPLSEPTSFEL